ncbi:PKD domain-containing protein, partial [Singulisphaera acidiphila]
WDLDNNGTYEAVGQTVASTFLDNGIYIVNLRVTDSAGQVALASATVNVANVAPTASVSGPYNATAGKAITLTGAATDPSPIDTAAGFIYTWNFGDGTPNISGKGLTNPSHVYAKPGTYTILVTATDKDNATSPAASTIVNVAKAPDPILTASAGGPYSSLEGATKTFTATAAGGNGIYTYTWDLDNNGTYEAVGQTAASTFLDNGIYIVNLRVTDSAGQVALASATVNVANVAPTVFGSGSYSAFLGQTLTLHASATDPSPVDTAAGFIYTWDFGDGSAPISGLGLTSPSHVYTTAGEYTATVTATDKDGGVSPMIFTMVTIFSLSPVNGLANLVLTPGWATFGQVLPQGVAHDGLQLGNLVTQTDVKTTWPDGSIRYAIVSAAVPVTGTYVLTEATPRVGSFIPTIPDASVRLTIGGVLYTATLPKAKSSDLWLNGPLVTEWRTTVAPVDPAGKPHPFLRVIFDTRSYQDGPDRLDVTVENVLDVAGATKVDYDVSIAAGGQTLFSQAGVTQYYLTRWRKVFDLGLNESQVIHDFEPFYEAGALPRYLDTITNQTYSTTGDTFNILGRGGNTYDAMGAAGGRPELAPYPDWAAQYLVYQTASQQDYTLANGTLAGSWPVHIREADGSLVSIDNRPNFWLDTRGQGPYSYVPVSDQPKGDLTAASTGPLTPDLAHVPSLAYIPYLVTGDRYLADEVAFWGNIGLIKSWQAAVSNGPTLGGRGGALGIVGTEQVRARAWALRNLVDAAAYLPNADPAKNYFSAKVKNNLDYYNTYAQNHVTPLGTVFEQPMYTTSPDMSVWMNNYLAWSIDHANEQGFTGGLLLRNRIVDFQLKLFTSGPAYAREQAAPYYLTVGRILPGGTWEYFATMDDLFKQNFGTTQSTERPFTGYYGTDARITLILAANQGLAGAQDAYDWLTPQILSDIKSRSGWAIAQKKPQ